jgi:hypothetical protein
VAKTRGSRGTAPAISLPPSRPSSTAGPTAAVLQLGPRRPIKLLRHGLPHGRTPFTRRSSSTGTGIRGLSTLRGQRRSVYIHGVYVGMTA